MPILVVCPSCSAKLNAPDAAAGKKVKCPKPGCGTVIGVPAPLPQFEEENDQPKPAAKKAVARVEDDVSPKKKTLKSKIDDNGDDEQPKSKRRQDDDEEEDERPKNKRRGDEVDEDDRPRKKQKKKQAGIPPVAIVGIVLVGLLVMSGVGYGIYALAFSDDKPSNSSSSSSSGGGGGGSSTLTRTPVPDGWVEFKSSEGGFRAFFPIKPKEISEGEMRICSGENKVSKGAAMVTIITPTKPPNGKKEEGEKYIKELILSAARIKEISHKDTTLAGLTAVEYMIEIPSKGEDSTSSSTSKIPKNPNNPKENVSGAAQGRAVFRVAVTDKKVIIAGVGSDTGMPSNEWISGFFDNFELVK